MGNNDSDFLRAADEFMESHQEVLEALAQASYPERQKEISRVKEALAKKPGDRTGADWTVIQYSPFGTANSCGY